MQSQFDIGIDARALVHYTNDPYRDLVTGKNERRSKQKLNAYRFINSGENRLGTRNSLNLPWTSGRPAPSISEVVNSLEPDILNIHWIPNTVNLLDLAKVSKAGIVLTLHDVWPLTAGCHTNLSCGNWKSGCGNCFQYRAFPVVGRKPESSWKLKLKAYEQIERLGVVGPSSWISEMATNSPFFQKRPILTINNPRPNVEQELTNDYEPQANKVKISFVIAGDINQYHKGFDLLVSALCYLSKRRDLSSWVLNVIGTEVNSDWISRIPISVSQTGLITSQSEMAHELQTSNLLVNTSRQDNFPNTIIEALTQGTPCVSFAIGGIPEMIFQDENGYLARPFDISDLADSIEKGLNLESKDLRGEISKNAIHRYSRSKCAYAYKEFYDYLIS